MARPHWQHVPEHRMYETRQDGVHLKVYETMFGNFSYSVVKDGKIEAAGNCDDLEAAQRRAEERS